MTARNPYPSWPTKGVPPVEVRPLAYTVKEAAMLLKVNRSTLYEALERGDLPGRKLGRDWRIGAAALYRWLSEAQPRHVAANDPAHPTWP